MLKLKKLPETVNDLAYLSPATTPLHRTGMSLLRSLVRLRSRRPSQPRELDLYAEAGAPEGALYASGKLVDYLPGMTTLYVGR